MNNDEKPKKPSWVAPASRSYYLCPKTNSLRRKDFLVRDMALSRAEVKATKREEKNRRGREARAKRRMK